MKPIILIITLAALVGCMPAEQGSPEMVEVVAVSPGKWDTKPYTVVEFPDGERRYRTGEWGTVGDKISARKYAASQWRSAPTP
ncbi:MAG: hypothetical protein AAGI37_17820 [Planctomycetota bacterium]